MIYLFLCVVCSTLLFINFKLFAKYNVKTIQAIVINYTVCVSVGLLSEGNIRTISEITSSEWFIHAICLGSLFISIFYITALTVKYSGIAVASIAGKLSLIIPTISAYFLYDDAFGVYKVMGILAAVVAIFFTIYTKENTQKKKSFSYFLYPLFILAGNGIIDTYANYNQRYYVDAEDFNFFLVFVFGTAAVMGWVVLFSRYIALKETIALRSVFFGILLGVPNYGSMYFLIQALEKSGLESSSFFPVNNICIVLFSCLSAWLLFHEKLSKLNIIGIILAIVAIILIMIN